MAFKFTKIKENFEKVKEQLVEAEKKGSGPSNADWLFKPTKGQNEDETSYKIRFLPVPESSTGMPWVELRYHMFERAGDNKYIKVLDPRSVDSKNRNPISELVNKLYKSDNALDQEQAGKLRSKARYFTLVYVKEAPDAQKNLVGKVLIYEAGYQVFQMMDKAIKKLDLCFWDPYEGTDFLLTVSETGGAKKYPSYLQSDFVRSSGPITKDEAEMTKIEEAIGTIKIKEKLIRPDSVKTPEELLELLEGGLKSTGDINKSSGGKTVRDIGAEIGNSTEPDFPEPTRKPAPVEKKVELKKEEPKKAQAAEVKKEEPKKAQAAEVKKEEPKKAQATEAEVDDFNIDFKDSDFNIDA